MENWYLSHEDLPKIQNCWVNDANIDNFMFDLDDPDYQLMMTWLQHEKIDMYCKTHQSIFELKKSLWFDQYINDSHNEILWWEITYIVEEGDNLWKILQREYWFKKWSEISKKLQEIYKLNPWLTSKIHPWQEIQLPIDDIDEYVDRKFERGYNRRSEELERIENERINKVHELQSNEWKDPMFQFQPEDFENRLDNNLYSWELQSDAFDVYTNMKNTKWTQVIWKYRNKDWEVKDIILWDNRWKNIYMELNWSYILHDIDSWVIDNISSHQELESVMVKLLDLYERENREIH
jgi:hypothetical protein